MCVHAMAVPPPSIKIVVAGADKLSATARAAPSPLPAAMAALTVGGVKQALSSPDAAVCLKARSARLVTFPPKTDMHRNAAAAVLPAGAVARAGGRQEAFQVRARAPRTTHPAARSRS